MGNVLLRCYAVAVVEWHGMHIVYAVCVERV